MKLYILETVEALNVSKAVDFTYLTSALKCYINISENN